MDVKVSFSKGRSEGRRHEEGSPLPIKGKEEEVGEASYSKAGPSGEEEEEGTDLINRAVTTPSISLVDLQDVQKDFSHCSGKHIVTWLL